MYLRKHATLLGIAPLPCVAVRDTIPVMTDLFAMPIEAEVPAADVVPTSAAN